MPINHLKLSVRLPAGVSVTPELQKNSEAAVKQVISELADVARIAAELQRQGFDVSAEDLLKKRSGGTKAPATKHSTKPAASGKPATRKPKGKRKGRRVVLSDSQKKDIEKLLSEGTKARECAEKYDVSTATVNNIKRAAGLTKATPAQKKAFAERKSQTEAQTQD